MAENVSILQQKRGRISRLSVTKVERFKVMWLKNGFIMYMLKRGTGSSLRACVDRFTFCAWCSSTLARYSNMWYLL
jgi:hypothetical protein